ncbi:hypothetical protein JHK82_019700 [Glycine max]|uniref:Uncharacterized protein n=2 Tax=Glycine subgen. Soja TaxID=1462606 RepID=C6SY47_SOYBN|nr:uncharacterized protein LOC100306135 [Glycine max]KAG5011063.1 hypothetical protein JHK87_019578 [Glycine soja]ACU14170.1 unknown [Glycine max]KAG5038877.1 hypothetical protein JHK86_019717 [Glycine max]KAG5144005.1 hypothetical protein JHK82_019700 [Glycine max]KAH1088374.1 hypothetical protein GYH30_019423 [Glycine max]|eukprot:NP_001238115.1 uncharacterized protein LOC100306135 [Glycine max]
MAEFLGQLLGQLLQSGVGEEPMEATHPRHSPNPGAVAHPRHSHKELPRASFNNTGTQNIRGLINNTGCTKGNGNGSIVFGGFDSSNKSCY